jgi:hypothetical protein
MPLLSLTTFMAYKKGETYLHLHFPWRLNLPVSYDSQETNIISLKSVNRSVYIIETKHILCVWNEFFLAFTLDSMK